MPFTPAQADKIIKRLRLTWEGTDGDLNITYRPNLVSQAELDRMADLARRQTEEGGDAEETNQLAAFFSRAVIGWDFLQEDGTPYPIDADSLSTLGYGIIWEIIQKMASPPDPTNAKRSARSSGGKWTQTTPMPAVESPTSSFASSPDGIGEERSLQPN